MNASSGCIVAYFVMLHQVYICCKTDDCEDYCEVVKC